MCYPVGFAVTQRCLQRFNDDGVECEIVDVIHIKTATKFMSVMSVKFVQGFVRIIRSRVSHAL